MSKHSRVNIYLLKGTTTYSRVMASLNVVSTTHYYSRYTITYVVKGTLWVVHKTPKNSSCTLNSALLNATSSTCYWNIHIAGPSSDMFFVFSNLASTYRYKIHINPWVIHYKPSVDSFLCQVILNVDLFPHKNAFVDYVQPWKINCHKYQLIKQLITPDEIN